MKRTTSETVPIQKNCSLEKGWLQLYLTAHRHLQGIAEETELGSSQWCRAGWSETRATSCNGFRLGKRRNFFLCVPMESEAVKQVSLGGCAIFAPGGFQALTGPSPEQPGLTPELALLWVGGWTRDLPRSHPACDSQAFRHPKSQCSVPFIRFL